MKNLIISSLALVAFMIPVQAQMDHLLLNASETLIEARIPAEQVPMEFTSSFKLRFDRSNPLTWSKFPFSMAEFGWVYDIGSDENKLDRFEVTMKTNKESDYWALYTKNGELLKTREESRNTAIPSAVREELNKSIYSDWTIIENRELVRFFHDHAFNSTQVKHQFHFKLEKDGVEKNITFNWKGNAGQFDFTAHKDVDKLKYDLLVGK